MSSTVGRLARRKILFFTTMLIITVFGLSLFVSKPVSAGYSALPDYLSDTYDQYISLVENDLVTGGGNYTPSFRFLMYTPKSSSTATSVKINNYTTGNKPRCEDFFITQYQVTHDDRTTNSGTSISGPIDIPTPGPRCTNYNGSGDYGGSGFTIKLIQNYLESKRFPGYDVTAVRIALKPEKNSVFADVQHVGAARFSYIGEQGGTSAYTSLPSAGVSNSRTAAGFGTIRARFAPACDYNSGGEKATIWWKDADSKKDSNSDQPVTFRLYEITNGVSKPIHSQDAGDLGKRYSHEFTAKPGSKYRADFDNVLGRDASNNVTANTLKIWYPFDSASYDKNCDPPPEEPISNSWYVRWDSYLTRNGIPESESTVGNLNDPGDDYAPQPGQNFRYINDAKNIGDRAIDNRVWTCPDRPKNTNQSQDDEKGNCYQSTSGIHTHTAGGTHYDNDRDWVLSPATNGQVINFYQDGTLVTGDSHVYGTGPGGYLNNSPWIWGSGYTVGIDDGNTSRCMISSVAPQSGTGTKGNFKFSLASGGFYDPSGSYSAINDADKTHSWSVNSALFDAPKLCVNVPFYYNLTPRLSMNGGNIQQGDSVTFSVANVSNPIQTSGRNHTNSEAGDGKEKGVVELVVPSGTAEPTTTTPNPNSSQPPCIYMQSKVASSTCNIQGNRTDKVGAGSSLGFSGIGRTSAETATIPVGTKLCYAVYTQHPKNTDSGDVGVAGDGVWSYSDVICHVIVKSPKVHFLNTDVTVGRYRSTDTATCPDAVADAPITTVGAPTIKASALNGNLYGSWVEYGAFATGNITGFGSAATSSTFSSPFQPNRLSFGNVTNPVGHFTYGQNCQPNPFGRVKDDNSTEIIIGTTPGAFTNPSDGKAFLNLDELASAPNSADNDKTGYVYKGGGPLNVGAIEKTALVPKPITYSMDVTTRLKAYGDCGNHNADFNINGAGTQVNATCNWKDYNVDNIPVTFDGKTMTGNPANFAATWYKNQSNGFGVKSVNMKLYSQIEGNPTREYKTQFTATPTAQFTADPPSSDFDPIRTTNNGNILQSFNCKYQSGSGEIFVGDGNITTTFTYCWGLAMKPGKIFNELGFPHDKETTVVPPSSVSMLDENYVGFGGRDIVIYAKKNAADTCSEASSGNLRIFQDISFRKDGYSSVSEFPRITFIADCNIVIEDNVKTVDASLIAGDAIKTCNIKAKTQDKCNIALKVRGLISADRLLLWRTYGADLSPGAPDPTIPAETFDLSPSQIIANYSRGINSAKPKTVYEVDLPPRY